MRKIIYTILMLACVVITACTSEDSLNPPGQIATQNANKVSVREALTRAEGYFNASNRQTGTRSSVSSRKVKSIEAVRSKAATRSSGSNMLDTLYYIINYADDSGFAVMSADKRTVPLYAISEDGRFDINDTVFNKGLALFVNGMENDILVTSNKPGPVFPVDTTNHSGTELAEQIMEQVGPFLTETVRVWYQGDPLNKFCPEKNGEKCVVGCTALGTAQVMTYYKFPAEYNGNTYNWDDIKSNFSSESTAHLLADLGNKENFCMSYGTIESGANASNIDRTLYNMGYEHVGTSGTSFTINAAKQALKVVLL